MPLDFPTSPALNEIYTFSGRSWKWNGTAWDVYSTGVVGPTGPQGNTGATGPVGDYVISLRGLTGTVGLTNGSGIGLSVSGQTMTFSNTGVLSIDGGTGAITNVAKTNVNNFFSASQTVQLIDPELVVYNSDNDNSVTIYSNKLFQSTNSGSDQDILFSPTNPPNTVTFPDFTTTLAGLAGTQTFTGTKTFNALTNFPGGISAAGATFSGLARFNAGISAAGGMTLAGSFQGSTATFNGNASFASGISASGSILLHNTTTIDVNTYYTELNGLRIVQPSLSINPYELQQYGLEISANNILGSDEGAAAIIRAVGVADDGIEYSNNLEFATTPCSNNNTGHIKFKPQNIDALAVSPISVDTFVPFTSGVTATFSGNVIGKIVNSVNGITGAVNLAAGSNITITPSGLTLTIAAGAGFSRSINVITTSTTAGATSNVDYVYIGNTSGNINLTLPTAVSNTNRYTVKNSNIGILTVLTTSSQTIDGVTGYSLSTQFQAIDLLSNNSNWVVV